jgi:succinate-semialdehyde dehydrogenase/glutarate-semialdehyde dehydrogenase
MPQSINPATERKIAEYAEMSGEHIQGILTDTADTARIWAEVPVSRRAALLNEAAAVLDRRTDELALLITREMGKPVKEARSEIEKCAWVCRYYADNGSRFLEEEPLESDADQSLIAYRPLGVVLAVMPWNFPFWQVFRFAAPGLTAGNGAVLKHASNVTGCAMAIENIFHAAGYPENLFRTLVAGSDQIEAVISNDLVQAATLTGSEPAGSAVASAAGKAIKKTVLELGGSDPYLIFKDADLARAAKLCAQSRLINGGQSCIAAKRFIVQADVHDAFVDLLLEQMSRKTWGDPEDPEIDIGPMARKDLRDDVHSQVQKSVADGAECLLGGIIPDQTGYYYPPTVLTGVAKGMPAYDEEVFGPVAAVIKASDIEEAVHIANDSPFGLGSAVFTRDNDLALKTAARLQAGCCFINDFVKSDPRLPFGGIRKSGYGRELSHLGIREFVNTQTVVIK